MKTQAAPDSKYSQHYHFLRMTNGRLYYSMLCVFSESRFEYFTLKEPPHLHMFYVLGTSSSRTVKTESPVMTGDSGSNHHIPSPAVTPSHSTPIPPLSR